MMTQDELFEMFPDGIPPEPWGYGWYEQGGKKMASGYLPTINYPRAEDVTEGPFPLYTAPQQSPVSLDATGAARDVLAERRRQVSAEGWTPEHDDTHTGGEMAGAAACYALYGATYNAPSHYPPRKVYAAVAEARRNAEKDMDTTREAIRMAIGEPKAPKNWPWNAEWWKPSDRRRNLVKAAALILAEIERLDRKASEGGSNV